MFISIKAIFLTLFLFVFSVQSMKLSDLNNVRLNNFIKKYNISNDAALTQLRGGMSSSEVYKLDLPKCSVIRVLASDISVGNRLSELNMHKYLAKKNLAPKILFIDNEKDPHIIVMEYIDGWKFNPRIDFHNKAIMKQVLDGLRIIHSSPDIRLCNPSMMEAIEDFVNEIKKNKTSIGLYFFNWYDNLKKASNKYKSSLVNIHGDLTPGNILISKKGKVYFIDFQESRRDSIFAEFGYFFYESGLHTISVRDENIIKSVLGEYFKREVTNFEFRAVLFYMKATAFLCGLYRTQWIDKKYTSRDLTIMLERLGEFGRDYLKKGDYDKIDLEIMDPEKRTKYVLSFFNEYLYM